MDYSLPIEARIPELLSALAGHSQLLISAPPGAGKTSVVPTAVLGQSWGQGRKILMLEPRRVAAIAAAEFMSQRLGTAVGELIGYRTRAAVSVSSSTQIEVITEGILTRMLLDDPALEAYAAVIFDEFHERSIHADLGLALCLQSQETLRPDLRILVMSATIEVSELQRIMPEATVLHVEGKLFAVEAEYYPAKPGVRVEEHVRSAIHTFVIPPPSGFSPGSSVLGDVLVFLPGGREIRAAYECLIASPALSTFEVHMLSGETPIHEQRAILNSSDLSRRRIILSTNIAETSVTIPGVTTVIDGGLMRLSQLEPSSGIPRLVTVRVTQANATQRAGRAGRVAPGRCIRLWSEAEQRSLRPFGEPEIARSDIASLLLSIAEWGVRSPSELKFLTPPSDAAVAEGWQLLFSLGAVDQANQLTALGKEMGRLGVHPRLAGMLIRAKAAGLSKIACDIAALQEEEDPLHRAAQENDVASRWHALERHRKGARTASRQGRGERVLERIAQSAERLMTRLKRIKSSVPDKNGPADVERSVTPSMRRDDEQHIGLLLAWAYPDRVAKRRSETSESYLLASGLGARLPHASSMVRHEYLVACTVMGSAAHARIHLAEPLSPKDIEVLLESNGTHERKVEWDTRTESVRCFEDDRIGAISIRRRYVALSPEEAIPILLQEVGARGLEWLPWSKEALSLQERAIWLRTNKFVSPEFPDLSASWLETNLDEWLTPFLSGVSSLKELQALDLLRILLSRLSFEQHTLLEEYAPAWIVLPTGTKAPIKYDVVPSIEARLQELFGVVDSPRIAGGKVSVSVALLSPARRPLQITNDLRSFWTSTYPKLRGEMRARYPKHSWPENPLETAPQKGPVRARAQARGEARPGHASSGKARPK